MASRCGPSSQSTVRPSGSLPAGSPRPWAKPSGLPRWPYSTTAASRSQSLKVQAAHAGSLTRRPASTSGLRRAWKYGAAMGYSRPSAVLAGDGSSVVALNVSRDVMSALEVPSRPELNPCARAPHAWMFRLRRPRRYAATGARLSGARNDAYGATAGHPESDTDGRRAHGQRGVREGDRFALSGV